MKHQGNGSHSKANSSSIKLLSTMKKKKYQPMNSMEQYKKCSMNSKRDA
jgi:hypothetical protein